MLALLLATSLSAAPLAAEPWESPDWQDANEEPHLFLSAWGGEALGNGGSGRGSTFAGGEAAWAISHLDIGLAGYGYRNLADATREWTPVALARLTQRFPTGRGVEATFGFGLGAGRPRGWVAWYQVALGVHVPLGPLFLAGEIAFERYDLLRLGAGLGVAF